MHVTAKRPSRWQVTNAVLDPSLSLVTDVIWDVPLLMMVSAQEAKWTGMYISVECELLYSKVELVVAFSHEPFIQNPPS